MDRNVNGKIILVTGSAGGLGLAMVEHFLQNGAKLAVMLDMNEEEGNEQSKILASKYGENKVAFYKCNILTDLQKVFDIVTNKYETVDLLINNAGILAEKDFRLTIDVDLTAVIDWTMKFFEYMRVDKGGKGGTIINVSSIYGYRNTPHFPYYHAAKYGVRAFSQSLGHEVTYKRTGVRIVTLCPGLTHTTLTRHAAIREDEWYPDMKKEIEATEWQTPDAIGRGTVEIFKKADSGTVWLVEGSRPAVQLQVK